MIAPRQRLLLRAWIVAAITIASLPDRNGCLLPVQGYSIPGGSVPTFHRADLVQSDPTMSFGGRHWIPCCRCLRRHQPSFLSHRMIISAISSSESSEIDPQQRHQRRKSSRRPRRSSSLAATTTATTTQSASGDGQRIDIWTRTQLEDYASQQGVVLSWSTLGPGFRAVARAKHNTSLILGYVEGFVRPNDKRLLHLDKMEVFRPSVQRSRRENPNEFKGGGTNLGVGLLLGYLCLLEQGNTTGSTCTTAEFLAIDDEDFQHKRLVRYYKTAGFAVIKYVGDDWKDVPDRLVWGGCGTLLRQDIALLLQQWTRLLEQSLIVSSQRK